MKIAKFYYLAVLVFAFFLSPAVTIASTQEYLGEKLKQADFFRGGRVSGVMWNLHVKNIERNEMINTIDVKVRAENKNGRLSALISFLAPKKYSRQKLLLKDFNMWFSKPGLRRPIPISSRQRLSGSASNVDVVSANYYEDYEFTLLSEEPLDGQLSYVLNLTAKTRLMSYYRIKYWINAKTSHGLRAEFYGKSGKLIKTANYKYENQVSYKGSLVDFISHVTITDNINSDDRTILEMSDIEFKDFDRSTFQNKRMLD